MHNPTAPSESDWVPSFNSATNEYDLSTIRIVTLVCNAGSIPLISIFLYFRCIISTSLTIVSLKGVNILTVILYESADCINRFILPDFRILANALADENITKISSLADLTRRIASSRISVGSLMVSINSLCMSYSISLTLWSAGIALFQKVLKVY